jgi:hypothetical protein
MAWLHARHPVEDFEKWKPAFAATAVPRRKRFLVFAVDGNRNDLLVMEEFDTREDARAWVDSDDHRAATPRCPSRRRRRSEEIRRSSCWCSSKGGA